LPVSDWSTTAFLNKIIDGIGIDEGMAPGDVDNAIRALMAAAKTKFSAHDSVIAAITTSGVATMTKDTQANLYADLAHTAGTIALVYGDATPTKNDLYVKAGASGSGSWSAPLGIIAAGAKYYSDLAAASAAAVPALVSSLYNRTYYIGETDPLIQDGNTSTGAQITFVYGTALPYAGTIKRVRFAMIPGSTGTFYVKRFTISGGTATQVGSDTPLTVAPGVNDYQVSIAANAGEYIGFSAPTGLSLDQSGVNGWHGTSPPTTGALGNLSTVDTSGGFGATNKHLVMMEMQYAGPDLFASTEDRITAASAQFSAFAITTALDIDRNGKLRSSATDTRTLSTPTTLRYDVIYRDMEAGTIGVTSSADISDACERIPAMTSPKRQPLFNVRVAPTGITNAVPVWDVFDGEIRALSGQLERARRRGRRLLPKTRAKIQAGTSLRILGTGDSIVEIGALSVGATSPTAANGIVRDRATNGSGFYLTAEGSDLRAAITLYTALQMGRADDGAGAVHTRFGFIWELVAAILARGLHTLGTNLFYDNFAIAGTKSSDFISGGTLTTWGTNVINSTADLLIVNFGMNEMGDTTTEQNLSDLVAAAKATGKEVLLMGVAHIRPEFGGGAQPSENWEYTSRAIERAARYSGAAYLPLMPLYDERYIGAIGLAVEDACFASGNNHPGILEHQAIGRELSKLVIG
jgi:hypothetical protein